MGSINFGVPRNYIEALRVEFGITCFVETGTFLGGTARWAAERFERVITIELSDRLYRRAAALLAGFPGVTVLHGDTRQHLKRIVQSLPPSIVWLDAHYSGPKTAGAGDECPLLGEIAALAPGWERMHVLVDDARYFLAPPPPPHDAAQWPTLTQVVNALGNGEDRFVAMFEDVLVSLPPAAKATTLSYIHAGGALNERVLAYRSPDPPEPPSNLLGRAVRRLRARFC